MREATTTASDDSLSSAPPNVRLVVTAPRDGVDDDARPGVLFPRPRPLAGVLAGLKGPLEVPVEPGVRGVEAAEPLGPRAVRLGVGLVIGEAKPDDASDEWLGPDDDGSGSFEVM